MAKRTSKQSKTSINYKATDLSSWNFIIFLTLGFILLVIVLTATNKISLDLRSRAGLACPQITSLPRPEDCPGGEWKFKRDPTTACESFFCESR